MRVEEICRACLNACGAMQKLFDSTNTKPLRLDDFSAVEFLEMIMQTPVKPDEFMPDKICESCFLEIHRMYLFKLKCERSQSVLQQLREMKIQQQKALPLSPPVKRRRKGEPEYTVEILDDPFNLMEFEKLGGVLDEMPDEIATVDDIPLDEIIVKDEGFDTDEKLPNSATSQGKTNNAPQNNHKPSPMTAEQPKLQTDDIKDDSIVPKEENYECSACPYVHTKIEGIIKHMSSYHMKGEICTICMKDVVGNVSNHFNRHLFAPDFEEMIEAAVIDSEFQCSQCSLTFKTQIDLQNHSEVHLEDMKYTYETNIGEGENSLMKYDSVGEEIATLPEIDSNTLIGMDNGYFDEIIEEEVHQCLICTMVFDNETELIEHKKRHIDEDSLNCDVCGMSFESTTALEIHIKDNHTKRSRSGQAVYGCTKCLQTFDEFSLLVEHTKNHNRERQHECEKCGQRFRYEHNLRAHMRCRHCPTCNGNKCIHKLNGQKTMPERIRNNSVKCDLCSRTFSSKAGLNRHRRYHTVPEKLRCNYCLQFFINQSLLDEHIQRVHDSVKIEPMSSFHCEICLLSFQNPIQLAAHVKTHGYDMKPFRCTVCHQEFQQTADLIKHMRVHPGRHPLKCEFCTEQFTDEVKLATHTIMHNIGGDRNEDDSYECKKCATVFSSQSERDQHQLAHINDKIFTCEICSRKFHLVQELIDHTKTMHTKTQPTYQCRLCPQSFRNRADLVRHFREHTGERTYDCDICSETFSDKLRHRAHMVLKHDAKNADDKPQFKCAYCPRMFMTLELCEDHIRKHDIPPSEGSVKCETCKQTFVNQLALTEHTRKSHSANSQLVWVEQNNTVYDSNMLLENFGITEAFFQNNRNDTIIEGFFDDTNIEVV